MDPVCVLVVALSQAFGSLPSDQQAAIASQFAAAVTAITSTPENAKRIVALATARK